MWVVHATGEQTQGSYSLVEQWMPQGSGPPPHVHPYADESFWVIEADLNTMLEVSSDRILFSTDYPYQSDEEAAEWFDNCPISELDRVKIGRENAVKLFNLKTAARELF